MDIDVDEGEVSLGGSENEVVEETWDFFCLGSQDHILSPQMKAALDAMIEKQAEYGTDF